MDRNWVKDRLLQQMADGLGVHHCLRKESCHMQALLYNIKYKIYNI